MKNEPIEKRHHWTHQQTYQKCCINSLVSLAIRGKFSLIKHANHCCSPGLLQTLVLGFYWFCWPVLLILNLLYCDFSLCDLWQFWYLVIWWSLNDLSIRLQKLKKTHEKFLGSCASSSETFEDSSLGGLS
jgi:hypothetical protein